MASREVSRAVRFFSERFSSERIDLIVAIEHDIAKLKAIEEIKRLKLRYAEVCDAGYDPDQIAELFTDDAVWDGGERLGRYEGIEAIRKFFSGTSKTITWALHYMIAPAIDVAEDLETATGKWYLWQPCTIVGDEGPAAVLIMGRYSDRLRREGQHWKFSEIVIDDQAATPLNEGWVKRRFLDG